MAASYAAVQAQLDTTVHLGASNTSYVVATPDGEDPPFVYAMTPAREFAEAIAAALNGQ